MSPVHLLIDALAVHRATRLVTEDTLTEPLRNAIWRRHPPTEDNQHTLGYIVTCPYCSSIYIAAAVTATHIPALKPLRAIVYLLAIADFTAIMSERNDRNNNSNNGTGWS